MKEILAIPGWMDYTDFSCELGIAFGGNVVYPSEADLARDCPCVNEPDHGCGSQEVVVMRKQDFIDLAQAACKTPNDFAFSTLGEVIWTKEKGFVKA